MSVHFPGVAGMADRPTDGQDALPKELHSVREAARAKLGAIAPAGPPKDISETRALMLSSRTSASRDLPAYYFVYFLFVDLLGFPHMGRWEKTAWTVPVRYNGRLYGIEHRKMGLGVFAPTLTPGATTSNPPTEEAELASREIVSLIRRAVAVAEPYFEWRAKQAASGVGINVVNNSDWLFERYKSLRDRSRSVFADALVITSEQDKGRTGNGAPDVHSALEAYSLGKEARWLGQAAIDAFFSWTEHAFIHLAILQGRLKSGVAVATLAEDEWKSKFKAVLDISDSETKKHYDNLLGLRQQIRNFMAHGAFGKGGEAFSFHSGAGAVPVQLTHRRRRQFSLSRLSPFGEEDALEKIEEFLLHLWSGERLAAKQYVLSGLPSILTLATDGSYATAMSSEDDMREFIADLTRRFDDASNMDW